MKNRKLILSLFCSLFLSSILMAQTVIAVVDYMKVQPGNNADYLEVEKMWKNIHQTRLDKGLITFWGLYNVMFSGDNSEYNYVTVTWYKSMADYENSYNDQIVKESFPDKSEDEIGEMMSKTGPSRSLIRSEVYARSGITEAQPEQPARIFFINRMTVKPGNGGAYVGMENDIYKPMHEEGVKTGTRAGWSLWSKWNGDLTSGQYATVDSYSSWEQMNQSVSFEERFKKVHPDKDFEGMAEMTNKTRTMENREVWILLDSVVPTADD